VVLVAVIGLLLASVAVFVFGGVTMVATIIESFRHGHYSAEGARQLSVEMIELIDLFLLGTILLITSIGLYQLFIEPELELPEWLSVTNLEQLKFNLLVVLVVMLAVLFTGEAAGRLSESTSILHYGLAVAAVLIGIATVVGVLQRVQSVKEEHVHETLLAARDKLNEPSGQRSVEDAGHE
jgi:uncharacterized membrane protein YqhA